MAINYLDLPIGRKYPYEVDCVVEIGKDTNLNYVIIDKDVTIKDGRSLMGFESYPIYIAKKSIV